MASGIKGSLDAGAGSLDLTSQWELVKASTTTTCIVSACNRNSAADTIRIAVIPASETGTSGSVANDYFIEFDYSLGANSALERTGIVLETDARIHVSSAGGNVSFSCYGLES